MTSLDHQAVLDRVVEAVLSTAPEIRAAHVRGREPNPPTDDELGTNPSGEQRIPADRAADRLLVDALAAVDGVGAVASEEREGVVDAGTGVSVAMDPLDGSSNAATNNATGTIVGIYEGELPATGRDLLAAGFVVYGPSTTAVIARGGKATGYERVDGEWRERGPIEIPADPEVVGIGGEGDWPPAVATLADELRPMYKQRFSGTFAADVSQVLTRGGMYAYPQLESRSQGKLRHQFEVAPIAYVVEAAGGASTDGERSLLDRPATGLHARSPCYVGSGSLIERVEDHLEYES